MKIHFMHTHKKMQRGILFLVLMLSLNLAACASSPDAFQVGDQAPDFVLRASDGAEVSLADYRGRQPVLLYFHMADG